MDIKLLVFVSGSLHVCLTGALLSSCLCSHCLFWLKLWLGSLKCWSAFSAFFHLRPYDFQYNIKHCFWFFSVLDTADLTFHKAYQQFTLEVKVMENVFYVKLLLKIASIELAYSISFRISRDTQLKVLLFFFFILNFLSSFLAIIFLHPTR